MFTIIKLRVAQIIQVYICKSRLIAMMKCPDSDKHIFCMQKKMFKYNQYKCSVSLLDLLYKRIMSKVMVTFRRQGMFVWSKASTCIAGSKFRLLGTISRLRLITGQIAWGWSVLCPLKYPKLSWLFLFTFFVVRYI